MYFYIHTRWRECWRMSLQEILEHTDLSAEFNWRTTQFYWVAEQIVKDTIFNHEDTGLNRLYKAAAVDGKAGDMLRLLDQGKQN